MSPNELPWAISVHEAAHSVAHVRFKIPFEFAEIVCDERGWSGAVDHQPGSARQFAESIRHGDCSAVRFDRRLMMLSAGGVANEIFSHMTQEEMAHATSVDFADARNFLACNSTLRMEDYENYLERILQRTRRWMRGSKVQAQILAVASALIRARRLEARDIRKICRNLQSVPELAGLRFRVRTAQTSDEMYDRRIQQ